MQLLAIDSRTCSRYLPVVIKIQKIVVVVVVVVVYIYVYIVGISTLLSLH